MNGLYLVNEDNIFIFQGECVLILERARKIISISNNILKQKKLFFESF